MTTSWLFWALLAAAFAASTLLKAGLSWLVHLRLGWRVHSHVSCDLRRKHAGFQTSLQLLLNRFQTLLQITFFVILVNAVSCLALALRPQRFAPPPGAGGGELWLL